MDTGSSPCFAFLAASSQTSVVTVFSFWPSQQPVGAPNPTEWSPTPTLLCHSSLQGHFALTWLVRLSLRQSVPWLPLTTR